MRQHRGGGGPCAVIGPSTVGIRVCQSAFRDNRIAPNRFVGPQQAFAVNQSC